MATDGNTDEIWHPARLIPTTGIRGQEEQERRATSVLLAVMRAVPDFGRSLLASLDAPKGRIRTFEEVPLKHQDGQVSRPDGAIVVERGRTHWRALVEVKTGTNALKTEQVSRYLDMAREHGFDAVLTISNEITADSIELPLALDRRKLRGLTVRHLSWWRIITEAIVQHRFRGISDPDQAWVLGELIAYLDNERSGAGGFEDMGDRWVRVRDGARSGTLRASDPEVGSVCERWEDFLDYLALGLSQDLGRDVRVWRGRKGDSADRLAALASELTDSGTLSGSLRIPDAVAPLLISADLRARQVTTNVTLDAPREGRPLARINWLLRQLGDASPNLRTEVGFVGGRETSAVLLVEALENPRQLLSALDPKHEPRTLSVALVRPMGLKRGKGQGSFVGDTRKQVVDFYRDVVQALKAWQPKAPKLPEEPAETPPLPQPEPPPFSATERDFGEAVEPSEASLNAFERPSGERD